MDRNYIAFISYRHGAPDSTVAQMVHTLIERYRIPKKLRRNHQKHFGYVFRDQEELPVSSDLSEDIRKALDASENLILICSPNTAGSVWVLREVDYFLQHHDRQHVFTVLAAGEPAEVFPQTLTAMDGQENAVEPLALDVRADTVRGMQKKLRREIFRLYAALLGCSYDALMLRHQRRRRRMALAAASVVLTVALGFSGMLLVKNHQIDLKNQELTAANEELIRQKAEVQLRESELLVGAARAALEQGDFAAAARHAADALPSVAEDRPYLAAAEQTLIRALGIFDEAREEHFLMKTTVQLLSPVEDFCISEDGTRLAVMDAYGTVTCHGTTDGATLWSFRQASQGYLLNGSDHRVFITGKDGVRALSMENGECLWHYESRHLTNQRPIRSSDGTKIAFAEQRLQENGRNYEFTLVILSTLTGDVIHREPFAEGALATPTEDLPYVVLQDCLGGFDAESSRFAGSYVQEDHNGNGWRNYYLVDPASGKQETICSKPLSGHPYSRNMQGLYFGQDNSIIALHACQFHSVSAAEVEKLDLTEGTILWETTTTVENAAFLDQEPVRWVQTNSALYLARQDRVYAIDGATGRLTQTGTLNGNILSIEIVDGRWFGFLTDDGTYTLGWKNEDGIFRSGQVFGAALQLGRSKKAAPWGGGGLRAEMDADRVVGVTAAENAGFLVAVPENDENTLVISRVRCFEDVSGQTPAELPETWHSWAVNGEDLPMEDQTFTGSEIGRIMESQAEAVRQVQQLGDGKYLLLRTAARQIYIVDRKSGNILFQDALLATATGTVWAFEDPESHRLYLTDDASCRDAGLCVDTRSWTVLAEIPDFVCYDPDSDAIYRYVDGKETVRCRLPDTAELVAFTMEVLRHP